MRGKSGRGDDDDDDDDRAPSGRHVMAVRYRRTPEIPV